MDYWKYKGTIVRGSLGDMPQSAERTNFKNYIDFHKDFSLDFTEEELKLMAEWGYKVETRSEIKRVEQQLESNVKPCCGSKGFRHKKDCPNV